MQLQAALESFNQALKLNPNYAEALNNRAVVLVSLKKFEEALESYDQAIALRPNYMDAANGRANLLGIYKAAP